MNKMKNDPQRGMRGYLVGFLLFSIVFAGCAPKITQVGMASYYGDKFQGRKTASGEIFRQGRLTAASPSIPFGTRVKVVNLRNNRHVKVRINDRGPFVKGRIIDLSKKAARRLDMVRDGVVKVKLKYKKRRN